MEEPFSPRRMRTLWRPNVPRILKVFHLDSVPVKIPYSDSEGYGALCLDLPDYLTDKEVRTVAAACRIYTCPFCCGDLLNWLQQHPEAPYTWQEIRDMWVETGIAKATLDNYKSNSKLWKCEHRTRDLAYGYHDAVRNLPIRERLKLMARAKEEAMDLKTFQTLARVRKRELDISNGQRHKVRSAQQILAGQLTRAEIDVRNRIAALERTGVLPKNTDEAMERFIALYAKLREFKSET